MKKWQVSFWRKPTSQHPRQKAVVEANSAEDALKLVQIHLNDTGEYTTYWYHPDIELLPNEAPPPGKVLSID